MIWQQRIEHQTAGRGSIDITAQVSRLVTQSGITTGLAQLFLHHTSASLLLCENADPDVRADLEAYLQRLVPDGDSQYLHTMEGPDDMAAHIRSVLCGYELGFPVMEGRPALGTWQGIYLWEHRYRPHRRNITLTIYGE